MRPVLTVAWLATLWAACAPYPAAAPGFLLRAATDRASEAERFPVSRDASSMRQKLSFGSYRATLRIRMPHGVADGATIVNGWNEAHRDHQRATFVLVGPDGPYEGDCVA